MIILSGPYCCKMSDHVLLESQNFTLPLKQINWMCLCCLLVACSSYTLTSCYSDFDLKRSIWSLAPIWNITLRLSLRFPFNGITATHIFGFRFSIHINAEDDPVEMGCVFDVSAIRNVSSSRNECCVSLVSEF
jgi:hypothetical protein